MEDYIVIVRTSLVIICSKCEYPCLENDAAVLAIAKAFQFAP